MFKRIDEGGAEAVDFEFEGEIISARPGDSVAAALLAAGKLAVRTTPVGDKPRGPFCMMGVCFDCLMEIDGTPNRQACQVPVQGGIKVRRQKGAAAVGPDTLPGGDA